MKKPNFKLDFVGIGAQRSGTTWVAEKLNQHPNICVSEPKEICYFNEKSSYIHNYKNDNYKKPFAWYKKRFIHCKKSQIKGEFSTIYLFDSKAPKNIHKHFPNIKIIACLRTPIERAYSQYRVYKNYYKLENRSFSKAVKEEEEYRKRGLYYKQLKRYLEYFNESQIHIVFLESIKSEPQRVIEDLYTFLGVNCSFVPKGLEKPTNKNNIAKSTGLLQLMEFFSKLLIKLNLSWLIRTLKNLGLKKFIKRRITKSYKPQKIDVATRQYLKKYYKNDIENLEKLLNKDLSHWK